jgi:hypothetical protein
MKVIYVGLVADDAQYHGSALTKHTGEVITSVPVKPAGLLKQIAMTVLAQLSRSALQYCLEFIVRYTSVSRRYFSRRHW